jgi:TolB protein
MRLLLAAIVVAALASGCGREAPCAFASKGAPWLALSSAEAGTWQVQAIRADGSCRHPLTQDSSTNLDAAWGRGGTVAYDSDRAPGLGIWIQDVAAAIESRLDLGDLRATSPAFSPDGATIAFEGRPPGVTTGAIYTVPFRGGTPTLMTPEAVPHGNGGPAFSPDGATIYFVSNRGGPYDVYEVPAAGGDAIQVTSGSGIVGKPSVSPDGKTLAFARAVGSTTEVVLYDLATGATAPLGVPSASEPAFDPAGGRLAVRVFRGTTSNVALAPLDGSGSLALTSGSGPDGAPAFAPQGR